MDRFLSIEINLDIFLGEKSKKKAKKLRKNLTQKSLYKEIEYKIPNNLKYYMNFFHEHRSKDKSFIPGNSIREYLESLGFKKHITYSYITDEIILDALYENNKFVKETNIYENITFKQYIMKLYGCDDVYKYIYEWVIIAREEPSSNRLSSLLSMNFNKCSKFYGKIIMFVVDKQYEKIVIHECKLISNSIHELIEKSTDTRNVKKYGQFYNILNCLDFVLNTDRESMVLILLKRKKDPNFIFNILPLDMLKLIWEFVIG